MRRIRGAISLAQIVGVMSMLTACTSRSTVRSTSIASTASTSSDIAAASNASSNEFGSMDTRAGTGARVTLHRCLYVHYTGMLADGRQFETSRMTNARGVASAPIAFENGTGTVMPGWEKGLLGMQVGGMRRLFVPFRMAYGASGRPPAIPPRTDLVFDVELVAMSAPLETSSSLPRAEGTKTCATWTNVMRR